MARGILPQGLQQMPARITRNASLQSFYTIRLLADGDRKLDAFCIYAYFRWLDDLLDEVLEGRSARLEFVDRELRLIEDLYAGRQVHTVAPEEEMLVALVHNDSEPDSGLRVCLANMLDVMRFDANRRGQLISQQELDAYTHSLSVAVTEALHYCIGHGQYAPLDESRYHAVSAAHIAHMLRDMMEDVAAGYINIPGEYLMSRQLAPDDYASVAFREWVKGRVALARREFAIGRDYLARVQNRRCRLAGYAYIARFEWVLDVIEREGYQLRRDYSERKSLYAGLQMGGSTLRALRPTIPIGAAQHARMTLNGDAS